MWFKRLKQSKYKIVCLMLYTAIFVLLIYTAFRFFTNLNIIKIDSFSQVAHELQNADKNTLVVFDVDDTLIVPESKILWPKVQEANKEWVDQWFEECAKNTPPPELEKYYGAIQMLKEKPVLIEPEIVEIIRNLQERGIKVIALTAIDTGKRSIIPSMAAWRFKTLQTVGIDFSKTNVSNMVFNELPLGMDGNPLVLHNGILFSSVVPKGVVLGAFLDRMKWKPERVIFFDDSIKHIKSVAQEMDKRSISFYGYEYLGSQYLAGELDKEAIALQRSHLIKHEEWLTEDEARAMLKSIKYT